VGLAMDLVALGKTLTEDESIGESRPSRCDVDRATSSEVERRKVEKPSIGLFISVSACGSNW
jgi:hypothetical protein